MPHGESVFPDLTSIALKHLALLLEGKEHVNLPLLRSYFPDLYLDGDLQADRERARAYVEKDPGLKLELEKWKATPSEETCIWPWRSLQDALRRSDQRLYVVQNLLALPSLNIVFGAPGTKKTFLLLDLAVSVASGKDWLPPAPGKQARPFPCTESPVLIVDVDNGLDRLERRLKALKEGHQVEEGIPLHYVSFPYPPLVANQLDAVRLLIAAAGGYKARLILLDNLGMISGGADENSSEMISVMANLRRLAEATGAAVVVIHHATKAGKERLGNTLRGHSSIEGSVDLALLVETEGDTVTFQSTKSRDNPVDPFRAQWTYKEENGRLVSARFLGLGKASELSLEANLRRLIGEVIAGQPGLNQGEVVEKVQEQGKGLSGKRIRKELEKMAEEGFLRTEKGARNATLYYLAEDITPAG